MGDSAMSLLKEEFKDVDIRSKKRATERLHLVARSLGVERTRKELIPWLTERVSMSQEDDEVLYMIAEQVGGMLDLVGGVKHAAILLEPLEKLCKVDETIVRERAVDAVLKLSSSLKKDAVEATLVPMVLRLCSGDWFTSRVSGCSLIGDALKRSSSAESQVSLQEAFAKLASDETPMVRRSAAKYIHRVSKHLDAGKLASDMVPIFRNLARDTQDAVRLNAISNCGDFAKLLGEAEFAEALLPAVLSFARDRSWRVRFTATQSFNVFAEKLGKKAGESLLQVLLDLMRDPEGEVRRAAVCHLPALADTLSAEDMGKVLEVVKELCESDSAQMVRLVLADACVQLLSKVPAAVARATLRPLLEQFLRDDMLNSPEIKLAVLQGLGKIAAVLGGDLVVGEKDGWAKLLFNIYDSSKARKAGTSEPNPMGMDEVEYPQWRMRRAIIHSLDKVAKAAGKDGDAFVFDFWTLALSDEVKEVRYAAAHVLHDFVSSSSGFGKDKTVKHLIPALNKYYEASKGGPNKPANFMHRIVFLHCFKAVRKHHEVWKLLAPNVEDALNDKVVGVKITALKVLSESMSDLGKKHGERFKATLQTLSKDSDADLSYWAQQALMVDAL